MEWTDTGRWAERKKDGVTAARLKARVTRGVQYRSTYVDSQARTLWRGSWGASREIRGIIATVLIMVLLISTGVRVLLSWWGNTPLGLHWRPEVRTNILRTIKDILFTLQLYILNIIIRVPPKTTSIILILHYTDIQRAPIQTKLHNIKSNKITK